MLSREKNNNGKFLRKNGKQRQLLDRKRQQQHILDVVKRKRQTTAHSREKNKDMFSIEQDSTVRVHSRENHYNMT